MDVGAVAWDDQSSISTFEFDEKFVARAVDLAPLTMPLVDLQRGDRQHSFPSLNRDTFRTLPGLLADSLPDSFGNNLIDLWLARNGRSLDDFTPVERLSYIGSKGMGALEYEPDIGPRANPQDIQLNELVDIANEILKRKKQLNTSFRGDKEKALQQIIQIGTSAGGLRPKAVIAISPDEKRIISGHLQAPADYTYWILKLDGVQDEVFGEPQGYGVIEYIYYLMAKDAGIQMSKSKLLEENGRAHFTTKRFDRKDGEKVHMQTLCGIAHYDYNNIGATSYEQLFQVMRRLKLGHDEISQMFARMVFNVVARNQDDHTKNTSFLLAQDQVWSLSPAYDVTYSYNPNVGQNTYRHQMSINGKRDSIDRKDILEIATVINIKRPEEIIEKVVDAVAQWNKLATDYDVPNRKKQRVNDSLKLDL